MAKSTLKIKPIGEYILVRPTKEEETTASGLIIQSSNKGERPQKGEVAALGTGRLNDKGEVIHFNVKVGDLVFFKKYTPEEVEIDGENYLIMKESDIIAVQA
ncbi:MAG: co-chaperone GroES [Candidatus Dojkabacteria bacterium]